MATETFNSGSGTWFVPTGQELTQIELWGAGGGGASGESGSGDGTRGGGGGGGGYCKHVFGTPIAAGTGVAYSVGAAGAGARILNAGETAAMVALPLVQRILSQRTEDRGEPLPVPRTQGEPVGRLRVATPRTPRGRLAATGRITAGTDSGERRLAAVESVVLLTVPTGLLRVVEVQAVTRPLRQLPGPGLLAGSCSPIRRPQLLRVIPS